MAHSGGLYHISEALPKKWDAPECPRCGLTMRVRVNSKTQEQFWGCHGYPKCRGTRPITDVGMAR